MNEDAVALMLESAARELSAGGYQWQGCSLGGDGVIVHMSCSEGRFELSVAPTAKDRPGLVEAGSLSLSYRPPSDDALKQRALHACRLFALAVGPWRSTSWRFEPPSAREGRAPQAMLSSTPATIADLGDEGRLLEPDLRSYGFFFKAPRVLRIEPGIHSIHFPEADDPKQPAQYRPPNELLRRRRLSEYIQSLGFAWDAAGVVRTVPTPASFSRLLDKQAIRAGFRSRLIQMPLGMSLGYSPWLNHLLRGEFPTQIAHPLGYLDDRLLTKILRRRVRITAIGILAHDMATHLLWVHRVPPSWIVDFRSRITARMGSLPRRVFAPKSVVSFFEDTLTHHCQELWRTVDSPAEFDDALVSTQPLLIDTLESAIDDDVRRIPKLFRRFEGP